MRRQYRRIAEGVQNSRGDAGWASLTRRSRCASAGQQGHQTMAVGLPIAAARPRPGLGNGPRPLMTASYYMRGLAGNNERLPYLQNSREAMRAPSAMAANLANTTSGSTAACPTQVP